MRKKVVTGQNLLCTQRGGGNRREGGTSPFKVQDDSEYNHLAKWGEKDGKRQEVEAQRLKDSRRTLRSVVRGQNALAQQKEPK